MEQFIVFARDCGLCVVSTKEMGMIAEAIEDKEFR